KTAVLVERFARAVLEDGLEVGRILAITFTEKAATELRERIRARLRMGADDAAAGAIERAWISTIHGFCARVLRMHALDAGLDPGFTVLDERDGKRLRERAFADALAALARESDGAGLVAAYGPRDLRRAILAAHEALRSRGQEHPRLPELESGPEGEALAARVSLASAELRAAAMAAGAELNALPEPGSQVQAAIASLEGAAAPLLLGAELPWPGDLDELTLPLGNAKALQSPACERYRAALAELRALVADAYASTARAVLDRLLAAYGERYKELKRAASGLDFEDLELLALRVLRSDAIGSGYRERFRRVMVDELQDTNRLQLELIDLVSSGCLFMVGDAQQSIYGFRHADVELFQERGRVLERAGARASLTTNFRARPEILTVLNGAFERELGGRFRRLAPGREDRPPAAPRAGPLVELLVVDRDALTAATGPGPGPDPDPEADYDDGACAWRVAEARALAARVAALLQADAVRAGDVVVLTRAGTDLGLYERALGDAGVPTYVIGGRGFWRQPQVIQLVCYLRALANPLDGEARHTVLLSPLCGLSLDGLVLLEAGRREQLTPADRERLLRFESWFQAQRAGAARLGAEELLDRALAASGFQAAIVALRDGRRRLANVRKLLRLAQEWEAAHGSDLRGLLDAIGTPTADDARESEAPVHGESLDAVRLMTIHRAKGLEFPVVCVADLGRAPAGGGGGGSSGVILLSRDGTRLG
ncbi:MAG: UvrD-helicase domain-containing protein, partial [Solirubrobacteraceae bacterium]